MKTQNGEGILKALGDDIFHIDAPIRFFGLKVDTRMTIVRFGDDLLLHSPVLPTDKIRSVLDTLGNVRWVVGPNKFHHLFLKNWRDLGAEVWGVQGLTEKRDDIEFTGVLGGETPWSKEFETHVLSGLPFINEAVFFHVPSSTLIVTDLIFNLGPNTPWSTRAAFTAAGAHPGPSSSLLERVIMQREAGKADLETILEWDFNAVVMAHGVPLQTQGKDALCNAFKWLLR